MPFAATDRGDATLFVCPAERCAPIEAEVSRLVARVLHLAGVRLIGFNDCEFIALVAVSVDPPDPSERVNVYLPKSLIARADKRTTDLGVSRSSFFGLAVSYALTDLRTYAMTRVQAMTREELTKAASPWLPAKTKQRKAKKVR